MSIHCNINELTVIASQAIELQVTGGEIEVENDIVITDKIELGSVKLGVEGNIRRSGFMD